MMRTLLQIACLFCIGTSIVCGQEYNMSNNSVTNPTGTLYDSGGAGGDYGLNEDLVFTICPTEPCECLSLNFEEFDIEFNWDVLRIYNGNSTSAPLEVSYTGSGFPTDVYLDSGCATLHFESDHIITDPGWKLTWSCSCPEEIVTNTTEYTTEELIEDLFLAGSCVEISNITFIGNNSAIGSFSNGEVVGFDEGIVLSTGLISNIPGINNLNSSEGFLGDNYVGLSGTLSASGDDDLDDIVFSTGEVTEDASVLEFDFVPTVDEVKFNYVFASEEYPEFVCSEFNDVFAFFISGPGFTGSENIALVPGTTTPVAINSVNSGTPGFVAPIPECTSLDNSEYYINSTGSQSFEFDGYTTVLTASAAVTACESYHIKIAIADVGDDLFDSAVFLEANSFEAGDGAIVSATVNSAPTSSTEMYEGCQDGFFLFERGNTSDLNAPFIIDFEVTGTATAGVDYTPFPSSIVIPSGETSIQVDITAYLDGIAEGSESIIVTVLNDACACNEDGPIPAELIILDNAVIETDMPEENYCLGNPALLSPNPIGGIPPLTYEWSTGSTNPNVNFIVSPQTVGLYYVTITDDCDNEHIASVNVTYESPPPPVSIQDIAPLCAEGDPITLIASEAGGIWSGSGITDVNIGTFDPAIAQLSDTQPFTITYTLSNNCGSTSNLININFQEPPTANISGAGMLCPSETGNIDLTVTFTGAAPWSFTYALGGIEQAPITNISDNPYTLTINTIGDYTLTGVNDLYCDGTFDGVASVTEFTPPDVVMSGGGVLCGANNFANLQFAITDGIAPYTITYTDGTNNFTNTDITESFTLDVYSEGNYEIISITDGNGCEGTFSGIGDVIIGNVNIDSATPNTANCGNSDGSIHNVTISGGQDPITYTWLDDTGTTIGNNAELTNVPAGNYTLIIIDGVLCSDTLEITIDENQPPIVDFGTANNSFCGQSNGSITGVSVNGGEEPYLYFWKDSEGNIISNEIDLIDVLAGEYTLVVGDFNGCADSIQMAIGEIPPPELSNGEVTDATCGENNGRITGIDILGGTDPFNYSWTDESGEEISMATTLNNLSTGTYTFSITDANNCGASISFSVGDSEIPSINAAIVNTSFCGEANGSITDVVIQGGTAPLFYEWQDKNGWTIGEELFLYDIEEGYYTLIVTDVYGCTDQFTYEVTNVPSPYLNGGQPIPALCGEDNGSIININVEGGEEPIEFEWTNGAEEVVGNEIDLAGVGLGDYTLEITDANGCTDEISFPILALTPPSLQSGVITDATCSQENGIVQGIVVNGGQAPFSYEWRNETDSLIASASNIYNIPSGIYNLFVTDNNGCTTNLSIEIGDTPTPEIIGGEITPSSCGKDDGSIRNIEAIGGTGELTYEWQNASGQTLGESTELLDIPQGNYTLIVTDSNGCQTSATYDITDLEAPILLGGTVENTTCSEANGSIEGVTLEGGVAPFTYQWEDTNGAELSGGVYTPEALELRDISIGTYSIIVTDSKGCAVSLQFNIEDAPSPQLTEGTAIETVCGEANGSIGEVGIEGGTVPFVFEWRNEAGEVIGEELTIDNLLTGTYTLQIMDGNGCSDMMEIFVPEITPPQLQGGTIIQTTCGEENGSILEVEILNGTAPFEYDWTDEANEEIGEEAILENVLAGTYGLEVIDANGCLTSLQWTIGDQAGPQLEGGEIVNATCGNENGEIQSVEVIGGAGELTFEWRDASGEVVGNEMNVSDILAGGYTVFVMDENGCQDELSFVVLDDAAQAIFGGVVHPSNCEEANGSITDVSIEGGVPPYTYEWMDEVGENLGENLELMNVGVGNYTLVVTDTDGCLASLDFEMVNKEAPQLSGGMINPSNCEQADGNITDISIEGGNAPYTYLWVNENGETFGEEIALSNVPQGTYLLTATDVGGCIATLSFEIWDTEAPALSGGLIHATTCSEENGNIEGVEIIGGNGIINFTWLNSENSEVGTDLNLNNVLEGTYTLIATDEEGCTTELQFEIPNEAAPQILEGLVSNARCSEANGGISNVLIEGGMLPYSYLWTDNLSNSYENTGTGGANLLNIEAGNYVLIVTDANGCLAELDFEVFDEAGPTALGAVVSATTCSEANGSIGDVEIQGGTAPFRYEWRDGNGNLISEEVTLEGVLAGNYRVQIIDDNGCETALEFEITDIPAPILSEGTANLSSCGNNDGGVTGVKVAGGIEPYTYLWQDENGEVFGEEVDLENVAAGAYTLIVHDANNCQVSLNFNVSDAGAPAISGGVANQTICGSEDGQVTGIEVNGGTGTLEVRWTNDAGETIGENLEIFDLMAGIYTFTAEDASGCIASQNFVIEDIPPPLILGAEVIQASCGASDGRIGDVVIEDGTAPFTYEWRNVATDEFFSNEPEISGLAAGSYLLVLTDANLCSDYRQFVLENLDAPELSLEEVTISDCTEVGTGSATVKVLGGTAPFSFEWDTDPPQFAPTATDLRPGDYNVSVRDGNDCLVTLSITVSGFMPSPIVDCILQTTSSLEFAWTAVTGAIGYRIETDLGTDEIVPPEQLSYILEEIEDDLTVVISVTAIGPDFCDNSETVIQNCTTLADCPTIDVVMNAPNDSFCADEESIVLNATPEGGVFEGNGVNNNVFDPAMARAGEHIITYTFTDEMGCEFSDNQIFRVLEPPIAAMEMPTAICFGETATVTFNGTLPEGANLQWNLGNGTTSNEVGPHTLDWSETGTYTVKLMVENGACMDEMSLDLVVADIHIEASENQEVRSGTEINLSAVVETEFSELQSLEWQPSLENLTGCVGCLNTEAKPFEPTVYTIVATNEHGCEAVAEVVVDIIPVPILTVPNAFSPNGDGINDVFQIQGINIETIEFHVFSRWGEKVFEGHSLEDYWDGFYKDEALELGVYVYYARAFSFDGEEVYVQGNVTLIY